MSKKLDKLKEILGSIPSAVVAFSGGTDSTFLLYAYNHFFPERRLAAVTISTEYMPSWEIKEAREFCNKRGITHKILVLPFPEEIRDNPENRCYLCKKQVFGSILEYASTNGFEQVTDGTNADDTGEHRPGLAALKELNIRSPLLEAGLTKKEIRKFSSEANLPTWNKPPYACLLTRIPHGVRIEKGNLDMIDKAELLLASNGFAGARVRMDGKNARIELDPSSFDQIIKEPARNNISRGMRLLGFRFISLDLEGYRTGSYNTNRKAE